MHTKFSQPRGLRASGGQCRPEYGAQPGSWPAQLCKAWPKMSFVVPFSSSLRNSSFTTSTTTKSSRACCSASCLLLFQHRHNRYESNLRVIIKSIDLIDWSKTYLWIVCPIIKLIISNKFLLFLTIFASDFLFSGAPEVSVIWIYHYHISPETSTKNQLRFHEAFFSRKNRDSSEINHS